MKIGDVFSKITNIYGGVLLRKETIAKNYKLFSLKSSSTDA